MTNADIPRITIQDPKFPNWWFVLAVILFTLVASFIYSNVRAEVVDLKIIAQIESNNNPLAYNKHSGARGMYQITEICLKDYNQQNNAKISPTMLFDPQINERVAKWYLRARIPQLLRNKGIPITIANILWAYNAGIRAVIKGYLPKETKNYIKKYQKARG